MATSGIFEREGWKNEFCPICKELNVDVFTLACGHSACEGCFRSWFIK